MTLNFSVDYITTIYNYDLWHFKCDSYEVLTEILSLLGVLVRYYYPIETADASDAIEIIGPGYAVNCKAIVIHPYIIVIHQGK